MSRAASSAPPRPGHVDVLRGAGLPFSQRALQLSAGRPVECEETGAWRSPNSDELKAALRNDAVLGAALARETNDDVDRWVNGLSGALASRSPSGTSLPGAALILRFKSAYGSVHHIATGTVWRAPDGRLRMAFLHQESIPDVGPDGKRPGTFSGVIYDRFDTRADHPDGVAPVDESVRLAGLPDVNVRPVALPQSLPKIARLLREHIGRHVYAASPAWPGVMDTGAHGRTPYATCFTIAELTYAALCGGPLVVPLDHDLGETVSRLAPITCIDLKRFATVGRPPTPLRQAFRRGDIRLQSSAFIQLGTGWGEHGAWDVSGTRAVARMRLKLDAGTRPVEADGLNGSWHALKFATAPEGLTLRGAPVKAGVTYMRAEVEHMRAEAACTLSLDVATPGVADSARSRSPRL